MKYVVFYLILLGAFYGCKHREINVYENTNILFDWANLAHEDVECEQMKVHFYAEDKDPIFHQADTHGFSGRIPYGSYVVLAFSDNARNVVYEGFDNHATACVYARKELEKTVSENSTTLLQPNGFYAFRKPIFLKRNATSHTFPLAHYIKRVTIKIKLTGEVERVTGGSISLSGIARGVNLATDQVIDKKNYIIESGDLQTLPLESKFSFFGINETENKAFVEIHLSDLQTLRAEADLTPALKDLNKPNSPKVAIEIELDIAKNSMGEITAKLIQWETGTGSGSIGDN